MAEVNYIIGVDPGKFGAFAVIELKTRKLVDLWDVPLLDKPDKKPEIDLYGLAGLIDCHAKRVKFAVIEDVSAMTYTNARGEVRGQGAAASFAFGRAAGIVHGMFAAYNIPIYFVKPSVWKMACGLSSNKDQSFKLASEKFPTEAHRWKLKKHDGRAEAALLASFGADRFT